jgi:hemerythrin
MTEFASASITGNINNARYEDMAGIITFLEKWITHHILVEDRKYSAQAG